MTTLRVWNVSGFVAADTPRNDLDPLMPKIPKVANRLPARIVALTGFMGAGKTCVGRALAALLGWRFVDLDQEIELQQKATVREIFQGQGEARFREIETAALREMLEQVSAPTVIALGGGTFVQTGNADLLEKRGRPCGLPGDAAGRDAGALRYRKPVPRGEPSTPGFRSRCVSRALRAAASPVPHRRLHAEHRR